jgi:flagellin-like protein
MNLRELLDDDGAVSPVIGVILMVAITVILAAVMATFVLGIGEELSQRSPNVSFTFDYSQVDSNTADSWGETAQASNDDAILRITHSGGPNVDADQLEVTGSSIHSNRAGWADPATSYSSSDQIRAGDEIEYAVENDDRISVTWLSEDGGRSATLQNFIGPKA